MPGYKLWHLLFYETFQRIVLVFTKACAYIHRKWGNISIHTCTYTHMVHTHTFIYIHSYAYMMHIHTHTCTCVHTCAHACSMHMHTVMLKDNAHTSKQRAYYSYTHMPTCVRTHTYTHLAHMQAHTRVTICDRLQENRAQRGTLGKKFFCTYRVVSVQILSSPSFIVVA